MKSIILSALALLALNLQAQETSSSPAPAATPSAGKPAAKPVYRPPMVGAPSVRVGGASRGGSADATVLALVPDHAALTTKAQPSLFWFQSKSSKARLELTLVEPKKAQPLVRLESPNANKAGIQRLRLSKHKAELAPNISYKWSVAIVPDEKNRSKDTIASGVIKRVPESADLAAKLKGASAAELPSIYAGAGLWYDALEAISDLIDVHPKESAYREQRAELLKQVGLPEAAAADRKSTGGR